MLQCITAMCAWHESIPRLHLAEVSDSLIGACLQSIDTTLYRGRAANLAGNVCIHPRIGYIRCLRNRLHIDRDFRHVRQGPMSHCAVALCWGYPEIGDL